MKNILKTTLLVGSLLSVSSASAAMIQGKIDFVGAATITENGNTISEIDFLTHPDGSGNPTSPTVNNEPGVVTGNFVSTIGDVVVVTDPWDLTAPAPFESFWAVGGFTFNLNTIDSNGIFTVGTSEFASISGTGVISHANFDDTEGTFTISSQDPTGQFVTVSFSSTTVAQPVPEPSTYAMFGTAFAILGFVGYRKRRA